MRQLDHVVVLRCFGWKAGVPASALASYIAAARVVSHEHWASDVVYGGCRRGGVAHTIKVRHGPAMLALEPMFGPGRVGVPWLQ